MTSLFVRLVPAVLVTGVLVLIAPTSSFAQGNPSPAIKVVSLAGHTDYVRSVAFSPDGARLLTGSDDATAKLWDAATGQVLQAYEGHTKGLTAVAFSRDGRRVLTGSIDATAKLWDTASGALLRSFEEHSSRVDAVAFSPDGRRVLTGSTDKTAKLWDASNGALLRTFEAPYEVHSAAFSPDGAQLLTGHNATKFAQLWDAATGEVVRIFNTSGDTYALYAAALSPDGARVLSGGVGLRCTQPPAYQFRCITMPNRYPPARVTPLSLWDARTGQVLREFGVEGSTVRSVAFSPDGARAVSGSDNGTISIWDLATGQAVRTFKSDRKADHTNFRNTWPVAFSPDGTRVLSADGSTALLWNVTNGQRLLTTKSQVDVIEEVVFAPLAGISDSAAMLWEAAAGRLQRIIDLSSLGRRPYGAMFSPDGTRFLTLNSGRLAIWDTASGQPVQSPKSEERLELVLFSPDGSRVLTADEHTMKLLDAATWQTVIAFKAEKIRSAAFSPDGSRVLTAPDRTLKLWDTSNGAMVRTFEGHSGLVASFVFSPDGRHVLTGNVDKTARLWDASSGALLRSFEGHKDRVGSVAFSPDGTRVLTGSTDKTAKLWDASSGALLRTFDNADFVRSVAFSPDGARVLVKGDDSKLWDAATGNLLRTFPGPRAAISRDGKRLAAANVERTALRLWSMEGNDLLATLIVSNGEWVAFTPEGFFDASPQGAKLISIFRDGAALPMDRASRTLHRPDLLKEKIAGDPEGKVKAAAASLVFN